MLRKTKRPSQSKEPVRCWNGDGVNRCARNWGAKGASSE
jgi:hypothetical protein